MKDTDELKIQERLLGDFSYIPESDAAIERRVFWQAVLEPKKEKTMTHAELFPNGTPFKSKKDCLGF